MGRRSGVPHTEVEIRALTDDALQAEIDRVRTRLGFADNAMLTSAFQKSLHHLEKEQHRRAEA